MSVDSEQKMLVTGFEYVLILHSGDNPITPHQEDLTGGLLCLTTPILPLLPESPYYLFNFYCRPLWLTIPNYH